MTWQTLLKASITSPEALPASLFPTGVRLNDVTAKYPMRINPYYLSLIQAIDDPIWKQAVPSPKELCDTDACADPLAEEAQSPVPLIIHRYPDRVIFLVSDQCAMYCRHCMRKRKTGNAEMADTLNRIDQGIDYIRSNDRVTDVILSGGDPLILSDERLGDILNRLRQIPHVSVIRIHSRIPCTLPQRITQPLVTLLKQFQPLFVNTHFNHPLEITEPAKTACARLVDNGIPTGCQSVLLKGVNDTAHTLKTLFKALIAMRVTPYYLHHPDPVQGTRHFRPDIDQGLAIMHQLRGHISGMCIPQYMIDLPGGGGKIPLLPAYIKHKNNNRLDVTNYAGKPFIYQ